jgi:uncharacterized protein
MRPASCLYEGTIRHRRVHPDRSFEHRIALFYVDLDELPLLLGGRLVSRRPGLLRFRRADYLGSPSVPLDQAVRDHVERTVGIRPRGPIRLLTQLRSFGHCFNPVSFYYCLDAPGERMEAVVAEVTNTPWGERHAYAFAGSGSAVLRGESRKALHVSPFQPMDQRYLVRVATPGERLTVHIESLRGDRVTFDATLTLARVELTSRSAARLTGRYPMASRRVLGLIYRHALALTLAGAKVYSHPASRPGIDSDRALPGAETGKRPDRVTMNARTAKRPRSVAISAPALKECRGVPMRHPR